MNFVHDRHSPFAMSRLCLFPLTCAHYFIIFQVRISIRIHMHFLFAPVFRGARPDQQKYLFRPVIPRLRLIFIIPIKLFQTMECSHNIHSVAYFYLSNTITGADKMPTFCSTYSSDQPSSCVRQLPGFRNLSSSPTIWTAPKVLTRFPNNTRSIESTCPTSRS